MRTHSCLFHTQTWNIIFVCFSLFFITSLHLFYLPFFFPCTSLLPPLYYYSYYFFFPYLPFLIVILLYYDCLCFHYLSLSLSTPIPGSLILLSPSLWPLFLRVAWAKWYNKIKYGTEQNRTEQNRIERVPSSSQISYHYYISFYYY